MSLSAHPRMMTTEGWGLFPQIRQTLDDRGTARIMEDKARSTLAEAQMRPQSNNGEIRNRHLAIQAAYRLVFAADDFSKGVRSYAYHG